MNQPLVAAMMTSLSELNDDELAAFNLAVHTSGVISPYNDSYKKALDLSLIQRDGSIPALSDMKAALGYVVRDRFPARQ